MFRHLKSSIDYAKLIEMQANQCVGKVSRQESKMLQVNPKTKEGKKKTYNIYNGVNRHH